MKQNPGAGRGPRPARCGRSVAWRSVPTIDTGRARAQRAPRAACGFHVRRAQDNSFAKCVAYPPGRPIGARVATCG